MLKKFFLALYYCVSFNTLEAMEGDPSALVEYKVTSHQMINPYKANASIQSHLYPPSLIVTNVPDSYSTKPLSLEELKNFQEEMKRYYTQGIMSKYGNDVGALSAENHEKLKSSLNLFISYINLLNQKNILKTPRKLFQSNVQSTERFTLLVETFALSWREITKNFDEQYKDSNAKYTSLYWDRHKTSEDETFFRSFQRLSNIFFHAYHTHFQKTLPPCGALKDEVQCSNGFVFYYRDEHGFIPVIIQKQNFKDAPIFYGPPYGDRLGTTYEAVFMGKVVTGVAWKEMLFDKNGDLVKTPGLGLSFKMKGREATFNVKTYTGDTPNLPYSIMANIDWYSDDAFLRKNVLPSSCEETHGERVFDNSEINLDNYYQEFFGEGKEFFELNKKIGNMILNAFSPYLSPVPGKRHHSIGFVPLPREGTSESSWQNYNFIEFLTSKAKQEQHEAVKCLAWIVQQEGKELAEDVPGLIAQAQTIQDEIKESLVKEKIEHLTTKGKDIKTESLESPTPWTGAKHPEKTSVKGGGKRGKAYKGRGQFNKQKRSPKMAPDQKQHSEGLRKKAQALVEEEIGRSRVSDRKLRKAAYKTFKMVFKDEDEGVITSINSVGSHTMIHMNEGGVTIPRKHKGKGKDLTISSGKAKSYIMELLEKGIKSLEKKTRKEQKFS